MTQDCVGTTVQQIQCALTPLADKLGQGAKYVWAANYRQTFIDGTMALIGFAVCAAIVVVGGVLALRKLRALKQSREQSKSYSFTASESFNAGTGFASLAVTVVAFGVGLSLLFDGLPKLLNPGYYTIARILEQVRG